MSSILSLRPDLDQNVDALPLFIAGALPSARPALAYEGRLSIRNPVGPCTVEQVGGDSLPPGSSLSVDNDTKQVVLAWPAYSEYVTPLENPGFETGDTSGWSFTPRGGGGVPVVDSAYRYEGAHSLRWPGGRGMGSEGGIEVEAWNNTIAPCLPGRRVTIHTRCMYNPAGHHFGSRYQGLIRFLDSMGNPIGTPARGKQFKGRGNNGRWNDASATAVGPAGTAGVQLGAWLTGSEAATWLDAASWDVPSSFGINVNAVILLTLRVRDSAGRTALWSGSVRVVRYENPVRFLPEISNTELSFEDYTGGTGPKIQSQSAFVSRYAFTQILPIGNWYFESDTRMGVLGGSYQWGEVGVTPAADLPVTGTPGTGKSRAYEGSGTNPHSFLLKNSAAATLATYYPPDGAPSLGLLGMMRSRHRIDVTASGYTHYVMYAGQGGGTWFQVAAASGQCRIYANVRGSTYRLDEPDRLYAQARLFSMPEGFAHEVPEGYIPLAGIL